MRYVLLVVGFFKVYQNNMKKLGQACSFVPLAFGWFAAQLPT